MKNKFIILLCALVFCFVNIYGQDRGAGPERKHRHKFSVENFKAQKNEYLKKALELTNEEAKSFLPLENELMQKKFELNKEYWKQVRELRKKKNATDAEYEALINLMLENQQKEADLDKEYYKKFKKILPLKKLYKYHGAEKNFRSKIVHSNERK